MQKRIAEFVKAHGKPDTAVKAVVEPIGRAGARIAPTSRVSAGVTPRATSLAMVSLVASVAPTVKTES